MQQQAVQLVGQSISGLSGGVQETAQMIQRLAEDSQKISSVVLELEQRLAAKGGELAGWGGQDFVGGDAVHSAPPALTRSEVLLRRLSAS